MNIIVPLAGPDYFFEGKAKGLKKSVDGSPQIYQILNSRNWSKNNSNKYIFILFDCPESRYFVRKYLSNWFPNSKYIYLSEYTNGAAFTVLSAFSYLSLNPNEIFLIDLADIYFETNIEPKFNGDYTNCSFIGYSFKSNSPIYSYFKLSEEKIIETREKRVISQNASAGVYVFKNASTYLRAFENISYSYEKYLYKEKLFVAPIVNGLKENNEIGKIIRVENYLDYKVEQFN